MKNKYSDDHISQVKPYKERNKFELFVHHKDFRNYLNGIKIYFPNEELDDERLFKKKMFAKRKEYALLLQKMCSFVFSFWEKNISEEEIQNKLHKIINPTISSVQLDQYLERDEREDRLNQAYRSINKQINSFLS